MPELKKPDIENPRTDEELLRNASNVKEWYDYLNTNKIDIL